MSANRKVMVGLVSYTDADGVPQTAMLGERVDLGPKDLERLERLEAVGPVDDDVVAIGGLLPPAPPVAEAEAGTLLEPDRAESSVDDEGRPPQVAAKGVWVDYAVGRGMDRAEAEAMTKQELVERA